MNFSHMSDLELDILINQFVAILKTKSAKKLAQKIESSTCCWGTDPTQYALEEAKRRL